MRDRGHRFRDAPAVSHFYFVSRQDKLVSWTSLAIGQSTPKYRQKSSLMLSQRMDILRFIHTVSIRTSTHFIKLKRTVIETMDMGRKTPMRTPTVNADLSGSVVMIVQLVKKSMMQMCHVIKQSNGWQIADISCPTKAISPISNRLWVQNLKFIL